MIKQARNGRRLSDLEGVGLIELTLVLAGAVVLAAVLTGPVLCRLNTARAERTLADMSAILEAGRKYYAARGAWPTDIEEAAGFLHKAPTEGNGWGGSYRLFHNEVRLWVETDVPKAAVLPVGKGAALVVFRLGDKSRWQMSATVSYAGTAKLVYEKR